MKNLIFSAFAVAVSQFTFAQTLSWSAYTDSTVTYSSPRAVDLTGDGVLDIIMGAGKEAAVTNYGILAFNGATGASLWTVQTRNEIFTSAQFRDITGDNIPDIFLGGRDAQLYAINGSTGAIIWEYWPFANGNPNLQGLYNFYTPQIIPDMNGDNIPDLLLANGGDHAAPVWQTNRPPGHLMIISASDGALISMVEVPDGAETYCSPVVANLKGDGVLYVVFGTGGETLPGSLWVAPLLDVFNEDLSSAVALATHPTLGFVAPPTVARFSSAAHMDIVAHGYDGTLYRFKGSDYSLVWSKSFPGTETSASPVIGNFTGNLTPDVFGVLYKGVAPSYSDFYQVMLDGETGTLVYKDSLLSMHFAAPVAFDSNGDGRDEVLISGSNHVGHFRHQLMLIDFQNNTSANYWNSEAGSNIGSTPWVGDLDNDDMIDLVFAFRKDSLNPMGWKGTFVKRLNTGMNMPIKDIAWGSYMGSEYDGHYNYTFTNCGLGSILSNVFVSNPSCNGLSDGSINPVPGNGTAPFTFLWSDGSVGDKLLNVPAGQYSLIVTDATGCSELRMFTLSNPYTISFGGINPVTCPGGTNGTATVSSTGCYCMFSGCNFLWEQGTTGYTISGVPTGMYTVTITHLDGCVVVDSVYIPEGLPVLSTTLVTQIDCFGADNGTIELVHNFNGTNYVWSDGFNGGVHTGLEPGNYTYTATDPRGCSVTETVTITEPDELLANISTENVSCHSAGDGEVAITITGGTPGYHITFNGSTGTNLTYSSLNPGVYTIEAEDANGCVTTQQSVTISEPNVLTSTGSSTPETSLGDNDGTASVSASGGTAPYTFLWNDNSTQTTATANGLPSGTYSVLITDANGCTHSETVFVSHTTGTEEIEQKLTVTVAPNPVNEWMEITISAQEQKASIQMTDITGRTVYQSSANGNHRINCAEFGAGNYLLLVQTGNLSQTIRVVIAR
ncbi:MAG TPA: hypothetical protein DEP18_04850 [Flavobacteriales bacterium]|nr:hypothetical protein [Flavobacteriales bacterium]HCA83093.1 hypothetical protein [Flavobacteriales bacterium]HRE73797.1 T9SS type A sorting domain-containing protein [Flavobacteriales bacterium]HRE95699.1 T9SS type A sorting domain-containing protein [Flavobacteriales bacterium]HRJ39167.1 T9SS type A sorting domain-containing protein [Flavobacteriales bacterium]